MRLCGASFGSNYRPMTASVYHSLLARATTDAYAIIYDRIRPGRYRQEHGPAGLLAGSASGAYSRPVATDPYH